MYSLGIRTQREDSSHGALLSVYFIEYKNIAKNNLFIRVFKYHIHNFTHRLNGMGRINRRGRCEYTSLGAHRSPPLVFIIYISHKEINVMYSEHLNGINLRSKLTGALKSAALISQLSEG